MVVFQDEALTSRKAESELNKRGKPYAKGDVDALAATYILEDYLTQQENK
jgi:RNase H-fold protein (predicted Holliday junction resolvase)